MVLLMSLPMIFCRNTILSIFTSFSLTASLVKFCFPTLCTFCWITSHISSNYFQNVRKTSSRIFFIVCFETLIKSVENLKNSRSQFPKLFPKFRENFLQNFVRIYFHDYYKHLLRIFNYIILFLQVISKI